MSFIIPQKIIFWRPSRASQRFMKLSKVASKSVEPAFIRAWKWLGYKMSKKCEVSNVQIFPIDDVILYSVIFNVM